ncbi:transporter substrate-binding domain-containing protein [Leucobacter soli]|uniref:Solute-binding protein family 3/N-terminal domain-containing protein n=1 Tax=Leucobacter soli TaxID=2812850 RepID=A0A916NGC1_9MICO|nr:transporter substrate-binding domain-containing protein [Leucobacter soli]CAG7606189.1 hypothetical protein LEUCIP111803_00898 [Leucobacter soli]
MKKLTMNSRRSVAALGLSVALAGSLVACSSADNGDAGGDNGGAEGVDVAGVIIQKDDELAAMLPEDVAAEGKLTAIQYDNAPADTFLDEDSNLVGWGPDLGRAVAATLGLEYEAEVSGAFDTFMPGIQNGRYDTSWASIIISDERLEVVDIVSAHESTTGVITNEGSGLTIAAPEDLCGLKVGALAGSAFLIQIEEIGEICEDAGESAPSVDSFPQQGAAVLAVQSDRIDAFMTAKGQLTWLFRDGSDVEGLEVQPLDYQPNLEGVAVGKDSGMTEPIAAALNKLIGDGSYEKILATWGIDFGLVETAEVNPAV